MRIWIISYFFSLAENVYSYPLSRNTSISCLSRFSRITLKNRTNLNFNLFVKNMAILGEKDDEVTNISYIVLTLLPLGPGRPILPGCPLIPMEPGGPGRPSSPGAPYKVDRSDVSCKFSLNVTVSKLLLAFAYYKTSI